MSEEQLIAEAILQLKQESNVIKDYIFPIAMALFSSLIGALVGYKVYLRQEKLTIERGKLDIANKWSIMAYQMHQQLISIKANYYDRLNSSHPIARAFSVPAILIPHKNYEFNYFELIPIMGGEGKHNLGMLACIFDNYLNLFPILQQRNGLYLEIIHELKKEDIQFNQITNFVERENLNKLIDLTELTVRRLDDLVTELYAFMSDFPEQAKKAIDSKIIKTYGGLAQFNFTSNQKFQRLLKDVPSPDYSLLSEMTGRSPEELKLRYKPLFKDQE